MKLPCLSVFCSILFAAVLPCFAEAAMVDFEAYNYYTAGSSFVGIDGWQVTLTFDGPVVVTPDPGGSGDTTVLSGDQSGRVASSNGNTTGIARLFTQSSVALADGTIVSGHMQMDATPGGYCELFFSHNPYGAATPGGISGRVGDNFYIFGTGGYIDTGISSLSNVDYLLEMELNLSSQSFTAYATNVTAGGTRTSLGSLPFNTPVQITPEMYSQSGFVLVTRHNAAAVYDDLDITGTVVGPVEPALSNKVNFELPDYVRGTGVVGFDGWRQPLGAAIAVVINNADVLEGSQSLRVAGGESAVLQRNFQPQTTYADGSVISARMKLLDGAGGQGGFYFSHDQTGLATPAGIIGVEGGNFWIFGLREGAYDDAAKGLDTGISFIAGVDYLLEMQFDFTDQLFYSYMANLTDAGPRTLLGAAEFQVGEGYTVEPGDGSNSGYVVKTKNGATVIFDEFNLSPGILPEVLSVAASESVPEPSLMIYLIALPIGFTTLCRRRG